MKLFSSKAVLLCSFPDDADDSALCAALAKHSRHAPLQLVGSGTLFVKQLREQSHEFENLQTLRTLLPAEHLVRARVTADGKWLLMDRVPSVFPSMHSFHDLLRHSKTVPQDVVQSCLAQVVALLIAAHEADERFAHNDFKADNILLRLEDREGPLQIGSLEVRHVGVRVVLIDMETVTGTRFPPIELPNVPPDKLELFGLDPRMPWCEWTDFHLLCMEMFKTVRLQNPKWSEACLEFLGQCVPTLRVFSTHDDGNILVTSMNRLSTRGRAAVNSLLATGSVKHLREVVCLPFLAAWVHEIQTSTAADTSTESMPAQAPTENETT